MSLLEENLFSEGFRPVPEGLSELVFITNNVTSSRLQNATLDMISDEGNQIKAKITELNLEIEVPKDFTLKSLRTPVGLPTMDVSNNPDYLITAPYNGYEKVKAISKFKGEPDWKNIKKNALLVETNLVLCRRINPYSPSQYFFAFYSNTEFAGHLTENGFRILKSERDTHEYNPPKNLNIWLWYIVEVV